MRAKTIDPIEMEKKFRIHGERNTNQYKIATHVYQGLPDKGRRRAVQKRWNYTYVQVTAATILHVEHGMSQASHQHYSVRLRYDLISLWPLAYRYFNQSAGYCTIPQPIS